MDKLNENTRERKQIKLGEIDTGPILVALLLGFIAVGELATWCSLLSSEVSLSHSLNIFNM